MAHPSVVAPGLMAARVHPVVHVVVSHIEKVTGLSFEDKDLPGIEAKLSRRAGSLGLSGLAAYGEHLKSHLAAETTPLIGLLTTHHTAFFREFIHFQELERRLVPAMLRHSAQRRLKVWSAASSRGHEAYSLAMFLEHLSPRLEHFDFSIVATDIDPESVAFGANGVYLAREVHQSPAMYLGQHWARGRDELSGWVKARASLRRRINWATANLLQPNTLPRSSKMDVIFCRNVFLYFKRDQIRQAMASLIERLEPWGVVALGVCENLQDMDLPLVPLGHSFFALRDSIHVNGLQGQRRVVRVLAVDDSPTVLAILKRVLVAQEGFEIVATAKNLAEARSAMLRLGSEVDLMTLDLHLGQETGIDYLKSIQGQRQHVPVVVVSALNRESEAMAREALTLGAVDYVEKPEGAHPERMGQELRAKLNAALPKSSARQQGQHGQPAHRAVPTPSLVRSPSAPEALGSEIRVVVVDDSETMTRVLTQMINGSLAQGTGPKFRVVAAVTDPHQLADALRKHKPDVMTLDMNMPGFNGVELLQQLPAELRVPAVVVSSLGLEQGSLVLDALAEGAVDYFPKPSLVDLAKEAPALLEKLEVATRVGARRPVRVPRARRSPQRSAAGVPSIQRGREQERSAAWANHVILIGASTGGTEAIREVLQDLPTDCPPICIVQHIPPVFSAAFAKRLQETCGRPVVEVKDGQLLVPGHAYVAPGDRHFVVQRGGSGFVAALLDTPKYGGHRPSVDVLFESVSVLRGVQCCAALLTGMGRDGAEGMLKLRSKGAHTICQSEQSCVVFGMPRAAIERGAAEYVEDLPGVAKRLAELLRSS